MASSELLHPLARRGSPNSTHTPARMPKSKASASTKANTRAIATLTNAARHRATRPIETPASPHVRQNASNPLWEVAAALAVLLGATALIIMIE